MTSSRARTSSAITRRALLAGAAAIAAAPHVAHAQQSDRIVFGTNWRAQGEHGGFYHAVATGIYRRQGLDVTIRQGGPQINSAQLLAAGRLDFNMGASLFGALQALKGKPIMISAGAVSTYWQFLKQRFGYTDSQIRPYVFQLAPFLADKKAIQQGYLTSEPFKAEQAGVKPVVLLLADGGYTSYTTTIETRNQVVSGKPDLVRRFVDASIVGWYGYM